MDEREALEKMPEWAPEYLACWGSLKPDGGRMTVTFAAEFAGTTPEAVRQLRSRSEQFERMEWIARQGTAAWAQSYVEAGLRTMAPRMMRALAKLLDSHHPQVVLKVAEWLLGKPQELRLSGELDVDVEEGPPVDLSELTDDELDVVVQFQALVASKRQQGNGGAAAGL